MRIKVWQYFTRYPQRWIQKEYNRNGGKCCLVGAMENQYGPSTTAFSNACDRISKVLSLQCRITRSRTPTLTEWNDNPFRSVEEVITLCKQANV